MDDSDDTAAAMAAAMGFSSFGAQKANKRRKINHPGADASASTGSNMTPLGVRSRNTDEIDLDMDDGEDQGTEGRAVEGQSVQQHDDSQDFEPQYIDTSRPSAPLLPDPSDDLQSKIDAIVSGSSAGANTYPQPSPALGTSELPVRDGHRGRPHNARRGNRPGTEWWEDYYDPSFLVNPWERLEKANGLEPLGPWLSWEEAKAAQV